jgi:hypothetical protein
LLNLASAHALTLPEVLTLRQVMLGTERDAAELSVHSFSEAPIDHPVNYSLLRLDLSY